MLENDIWISSGECTYKVDMVAEGLYDKDNQYVPLTKLQWNLLQHFLSKPHEMVRKDDLLQYVWHGRVVTDEAISHAVRSLRSALKDDAKSPLFIETVHSRGYRFIAHIKELSKTYSKAGNDELPVTGPRETPDKGPAETKSGHTVKDEICTQYSAVDSDREHPGLGKTCAISRKILPIISWSHAAKWPKEKPAELRQLVQVKFDIGSNGYALQVWSEAMFDSYRCESIPLGATIAVDTTIQPSNGQFVIVAPKGGGEAIIRQYAKQGDRVSLCAFNQHYPVLNGADYTICGVVKGYIYGNYTELAF